MTEEACRVFCLTAMAIVVLVALNFTSGCAYLAVAKCTVHNVRCGQ